MYVVLHWELDLIVQQCLSFKISHLVVKRVVFVCKTFSNLVIKYRIVSLYLAYQCICLSITVICWKGDRDRLIWKWTTLSHIILSMRNVNTWREGRFKIRRSLPLWALLSIRIVCQTFVLLNYNRILYMACKILRVVDFIAKNLTALYFVCQAGNQMPKI